MESDAIISECKQYRYLLRRTWNIDKGVLVFIMFNPSTAAHTTNDPTIRRCIRFAADNGFGGIVVANLLAYRCTNPAELPVLTIAVGPDNDAYLRLFADNANDLNGMVVLAWGGDGKRCQQRANDVIAMFPHARCLGKTKDGHPRHPLFVAANTPLVHFTNPVAHPFLSK